MDVKVVRAWVVRPLFHDPLQRGRRLRRALQGLARVVPVFAAAPRDHVCVAQQRAGVGVFGILLEQRARRLKIGLIPLVAVRIGVRVEAPVERAHEGLFLTRCTAFHQFHGPLDRPAPLALGIVGQPLGAAVGVRSQRQGEPPVDHRVVGVVPQRLLMGRDGFREMIAPGQPQALIEELLGEGRVSRYRTGIGARAFHQNGHFRAFGRGVRRRAGGCGHSGGKRHEQIAY